MISFSVPTDFVHGRSWLFPAANLVEHFPEWQDRLFASELARHEAVGEHDVYGCAQVQAEMGGDVDKAVAESPYHLGNSAVFRANT